MEVSKWISSFVSMKTIKVSDKAQQDLKVFAAKNNYNMNVIASDAIIQYVKEQSKLPKPKPHKQ